MSRSSKPDLFKWRHFKPVIIVCAVRWYLRYSLSYRDVQELLAERGLSVSHTTFWRWIPRYAPELNRRLRTHLKPTNRSWRIDETYICVKGRWVYLYRAIDPRDRPSNSYCRRSALRTQPSYCFLALLHSPTIPGLASSTPTSMSGTQQPSTNRRRRMSCDGAASIGQSNT